MKAYLLTIGHASIALLALWIATQATAVATTSKKSNIDPVAVHITGSPAIIAPIKAATKMIPNRSLACEFATSNDTLAVDMLLKGSTHVCLLTRPLEFVEVERAAELGIHLQTLTFGCGGLTVIVHPTIGRVLPAISVEQLYKIFVSGELTRWNQLCDVSGEISVICPPLESGACVMFLRDLSRIQGHQVFTYVNHAFYADSLEATVQRVAQNPLAVGFVWSTLPADGLAKLGIKLPSRTVTCNERSMRAQEYPFVHRFQAVCRRGSHTPQFEFLTFLGSHSGQQALDKAGMITSMRFTSAELPTVKDQAPVEAGSVPAR